MQKIENLKIFIDGKWIESKTEKYLDIYDPSVGEIIAKAPSSTSDEVSMAIESAKKAFVKWSATPVLKRIQVLLKFRELLDKNMDELTHTLCREHGKSWEEARGDLAKVKEPLEHAIAAPSLMMGDSLMDTSTGFDTVLYREPIGVFAGICPFNFPAMIPMGWMVPLCIVTGNTIVLKSSSATPMTSMRLAELYVEAGLPDGVINVITANVSEAEMLLTHKDIKGISFVGTTKVGKSIYSKAAATGKRVQALCEAKNHALVLEDAPLVRTAAGIINAAFGCAGERCMALSVVVVQESVADELVKILSKMASELKIGPAYDKTTELGPLVSKEHRSRVINWIEKGVQEGATLVLDGRNHVVKGYENGFYLAPTIFDNVTENMTIGSSEIFGPVLSIKRVKDFEEGITLMNDNEFGNGSVIFTQNGYYSREFARRTHAGMVGINVGIPVPVAMFPFAGHKNSFFGDLHTLGKDGIDFYTESKVVTTRWFDEEEMKKDKVNTWDNK